MTWKEYHLNYESYIGIEHRIDWPYPPKLSIEFGRIDHPQPNVKRFCPSKYFWQWQKRMKAAATKGLLPFAEFWALQEKKSLTQYYPKVGIRMRILSETRIQRAHK